MRRNIRIAISLGCIAVGSLLTAGTISVDAISSGVPAQQSTATPEAAVPHIATEEEMIAARLEWSQSKHSETYDEGMGANTTCARCKSPMNWDPSNLAVDASLNCAACKRVPGSPRPDLEGGTPVSMEDWVGISCAICHEPVGDSYWTGISYWDQTRKMHVPMESVKELCARCHEGRHGFEVSEEQEQSIAHHDWDCTRCHGSHGAPSKCTDCHDPVDSDGAAEHARHPSVSCTACHDQGGLSIWLEDDPASKFNNKYIPRRFAHTLTSWPSHDLGRKVDCLRCHHERNMKDQQPMVVQDVSCTACHPGGQASFWCTNFQRNTDPNPTPTPVPTSPAKVTP